MKKLLAFAILSIFGMQLLNAQSFKKRDNFIEATFGFTYYQDLENDRKIPTADGNY